MLRLLNKDKRASAGAWKQRRLWTLAALLFVLLAFVVPSRTSGDSGADAAGSAPDLKQIEGAFQRVVQRVSPSVVGIRVKRSYVTMLPAAGGAIGRGFEQLVTVNGSGTIIDREGLILTNEHVVQSAATIDVSFYDGQVLPATVVGADARSDLAVLRVERDGLSAIRLVDWSRVARGQWAITLGNPYGLGSGDGKLSVSVGVVANLGRQLPGLGEVDDRLYADMIQTTAAIHPGCSGGPLLNVEGELVGVVTAMHTRAAVDEGVGFAIPMTPSRRRLIEELAAGREVVHGYLGVSVRAIEPHERDGANSEVGAVVEQVDPSGPAGGAGLQKGDLIVRFRDRLVAGPALLAELVSQTAPGTDVAIELVRGGRRMRVDATLQRREVSRVSWMRGGAIIWRGLRLTDLALADRWQAGQKDTVAGVLVIGIVQNSPAQHATIEIGDVIEGVAEAAVVGVADFQTRVHGESGPVRIRVRDRGEVIIQP